MTRPALPTVSLACARAARFTGLATHLRSVAECVPTSAFAPLAFARPLAGAASFAATYLDIIGFPALVEAITEYEEQATPAAKFVVAMDRFHPILMDYLSEGRTWHNLGITFDKLMEIKDKDLASSEINEYYQQLKAILIENPELFPSE